MTIEKLKKLCLQYLEQDSETDLEEQSIEDLKSNDTFAEYLLNMEHVLYMALSRMATSKILPLQEFEIEKGTNTVHLTENGSKKPIFHAIKDVYCLDDKGNLGGNVKWTLIGTKLIIHEVNKDYTYYVAYHPSINSLETYLDNEITSIDDIELNDIGANHICVPDEMAINIKYLVYSEMKLEENASIANANKNYFENYLSSMYETQIIRNQVEIEMADWGDIYGN